MFTDPFIVEYIASGVINERSSNGLLSIFTADNGNPKTIDAWFDGAKAAMLNWPAERPCFSLHDFRKTGLQVFDIPLQRQLQELLHLRPDLHRHIALVMTVDVTDELQHLVDRIVELTAHCECGVFTTRKQAMEWLLR